MIGAPKNWVSALAPNLFLFLSLVFVAWRCPFLSLYRSNKYQDAHDQVRDRRQEDDCCR